MYQSSSNVGFPSSKEEAQKLAENLAKRLHEGIGGKWETNVWHNLWWCYDVKLKNGSLSVKENWYKETPTYYCYMSDEIGGTGSMGYWTDHNSYDDPCEAVSKQMDEAMEFISQVQEVFDENENYLDRVKYHSNQ